MILKDVQEEPKEDKHVAKAKKYKKGEKEYKKDKKEGEKEYKKGKKEGDKKYNKGKKESEKEYKKGKKESEKEYKKGEKEAKMEKKAEKMVCPLVFDACYAIIILHAPLFHDAVPLRSGLVLPHVVLQEL